MWGTVNEGAKFWLQVVTELQNRGVQDIFIACVVGLKGFPEAIETVFPRSQIQLCIVHMLRHSFKYVSWKQRKEVATDLKTIRKLPRRAGRNEPVGVRVKMGQDPPLHQPKLAAQQGANYPVFFPIQLTFARLSIRPTPLNR